MFHTSFLFISSGSDLLSRVLRQSTISVTGFNDRVRNGIGWDTCTITTGTNKQKRGRSCIKGIKMYELDHTFGIKLSQSGY